MVNEPTLFEYGKTLADAGLQVSQSPSSQMVIRGERTRLSCTFSIQDPTVKGAVSWHKTGSAGNISSTQIIHFRGRFSLSYPKTFLRRGDGSLIVSNVSWEDAGIYVCNVLIWEKEEQQGNGTQLLVSARPSQPEIYLQVAPQSQPDLTMVCRTFGFYPLPVQVIWYSVDMSLPAPAPMEIWKSDCGVFYSARHLVLPASFRDKARTFTCVVHHESLTEPLRIDYTYNPLEAGMTGDQIVEYLNILKIALLLGFSIIMLYTALAIWMLKINLIHNEDSTAKLGVGRWKCKVLSGLLNK
ncbi:tapasin-related protein-like [Pelodytes ibericus]